MPVVGDAPALWAVCDTARGGIIFTGKRLLLEALCPLVVIILNLKSQGSISLVEALSSSRTTIIHTHASLVLGVIITSGLIIQTRASPFEREPRGVQVSSCLRCCGISVLFARMHFQQSSRVP